MKKDMEDKIEELVKIKEENEIEIASLRSEMEEKAKIKKEKETMDRGIINSLEEEKTDSDKQTIQIHGVCSHQNLSTCLPVYLSLL